MNETINNFGYPENALAEYKHWVILLRPQQVTAASMVLACKEPATSLAQVTPQAYAELSTVIDQLEGTLKRCIQYDKINYLALMMVDKEVHFHVLPRYNGKRHVAGVTFPDLAWPKPPDIKNITEMTGKQFRELFDLLKNNWGRN